MGGAELVLPDQPAQRAQASAQSTPDEESEDKANDGADDNACHDGGIARVRIDCAERGNRAGKYEQQNHRYRATDERAHATSEQPSKRRRPHAPRLPRGHDARHEEERQIDQIQATTDKKRAPRRWQELLRRRLPADERRLQETRHNS
jgi:hypothetical protein